MPSTGLVSFASLTTHYTTVGLQTRNVSKLLIDDVQVCITRRAARLVPWVHGVVLGLRHVWSFPKAYADLQTLLDQDSAALAHEVAALLYPSYSDSKYHR